MVPARRAHGSCLNGEFWPDWPNFLPGACGEQGLRGAPHRGKRRAREGPAPRSPNGLPGIAGSRAFGAPCPAPQRRRVPRRRWRAQTVEGRLRGPCRLSRRCPHVRSQHALQAFGRRRPCHVPEPPPRAASPRSAGRGRGTGLACVPHGRARQAQACGAGMTARRRARRPRARLQARQPRASMGRPFRAGACFGAGAASPHSFRSRSRLPRRAGPALRAFCVRRRARMWSLRGLEHLEQRHGVHKV